eukprot:6477119-Amphidinium_carterae.2
MFGWRLSVSAFLSGPFFGIFWVLKRTHQFGTSLVSFHEPSSKGRYAVWKFVHRSDNANSLMGGWTGCHSKMVAEPECQRPQMALLSVDIVMSWSSLLHILLGIKHTSVQSLILKRRVEEETRWNQLHTIQASTAQVRWTYMITEQGMSQ